MGCNKVLTVVAMGLIGACCHAAAGQALLQRPVAPGRSAAAPAAAPQPASAAPATPTAAAPPAPTALPARNGDSSASLALQPYSMFAVVPPQPKTFQKHDLIQIIINENSNQKYEQTLDTQKKDDVTGKLSGFPSIRHLLEAQLKPGDSELIDLALHGDKKFKGDGSYERKDQFTTRISATIIDVKPNGTLVIEGRKLVQSDKETASIVIAGVCRPEDITTQNTVQSSQLAELVVRVENTGDVKEAAKKGWLTTVVDTILGI